MGFGHRANVACGRRGRGWRPIVIVSGGAVHQQLLFVRLSIVRTSSIESIDIRSSSQLDLPRSAYQREYEDVSVISGGTFQWSRRSARFVGRIHRGTISEWTCDPRQLHHQSKVCHGGSESSYSLGNAVSDRDAGSVVANASVSLWCNRPPPDTASLLSRATKHSYGSSRWLLVSSLLSVSPRGIRSNVVAYWDSSRSRYAVGVRIRGCSRLCLHRTFDNFEASSLTMRCCRMDNMLGAHVHIVDVFPSRPNYRSASTGD
jgi:hypothetical protein